MSLTISAWIPYIVLAAIWKVPCGTALDGVRIKVLKILAPQHGTIHGSSGHWRATVAHPPFHSATLYSSTGINQAATIILTTFIRLQHHTTRLPYYSVYSYHSAVQCWAKQYHCPTVTVPNPRFPLSPKQD